MHEDAACPALTPDRTAPRVAVHCRALGLALAFVLLAGCDQTPVGAFGKPAPGSVIIERHACGSCHVIPGVPNARGMVGPPLSHIGSRRMIAGVMPNSRDNLIRFLQSPQSVVPGGAMPDLHLTEAEASHVAAYLSSLQ